ncbi:PREDICTED: receptor-type tyrosine-protein phosphatase eta isoform X2 [Hipposideros armiger]|uniref:Receptor-type tyrosine-protein phosphatase eta n=1 Tax=Hipposideros armiger TaxID=186990 RepID=A0A8B7SFC1_HIPAR|nr:PREDICTED: receptor-type tyrosine-protein phosphatase eta isoform X2 [Hipposideros armiger]
MKAAAREARPPRRLPGLRWALPPLLLLCRLGQILCTNDSCCNNVSFTFTTAEIVFSKVPETISVEMVSDLNGQNQQSPQKLNDGTVSFGNLTPGMRYSFNYSHDSTICCQKEVQTQPIPVWDIEAGSISPTSVSLTWKNNDTDASSYTYKVTSEMGSGISTSGADQTSINITNLSPATSYMFSIIPEVKGHLGDARNITVTTKPFPVSDLHVVSVGVRSASLAWKNNGNTTCRMLLEDTGRQVNISGLKPGTQYKVTLYLLEPNGTQREPLVTESDSDATSTASLSPVSVHPMTGDIEVLLLGLKPDTQYNATVYSQASGGTEGQPMAIDFRTGPSQVLDLEAVNISATNMTLTWKINDSDLSSAYTYKIEVAGVNGSLNFTVNKTHAFITPLNSRTLYNITVRPFLDGGSEGTPGFLQVYTRPHPVFDFRVTNVSTRAIHLAWSSHDSDSFKILTTWDGVEKPMENITNQSSIVIGGLSPGTTYCFEVLPQGPNGTEGDPQTVCNTTDPSAVFNISVVNVATTEMTLRWQSTDVASEYTYHLRVESKYGSNQTNTSHKEITLQDLVPGTLYNITIIPEVAFAEGNSSFIAQYTRPSDVSHIGIQTNTTAATFTWENMDKASVMYTYRLLIERDGNSSKAKQEVTPIGVTYATVTELIPGSSYTVKISAYVGEVGSLAPGQQSFCTDPSPVASFHCEVVPKQPILVLKWACPSGTNTGFQLEISRGDWKNTTRLEGCSLENGTEYRTNVTYLNFSTSYDINITALSCNKMALPAQNTCLTGITEPPSPDESPNITAVSHNSVKVKFSGFEASHGPIKAYALILTTGKALHASTDDLKYTYEDFKKRASDTYVTYLITTEEKRHSQDLSEVLKYEIDVGNESVTHSYYNGKLEPLGRYRACVAGFTNITFNPKKDGLIDEAGSYVSFSRYSEAVSLPQDPGVICGAVFGCIFGAMVIVAVGGFIFWRKKRKDAKNNEVSFSQIKPKKSKLIRVENFESYFKKQQADSNCGFAEEYEDLKLVGINQPKYAAELAENRAKNRYNNVLPYDISRVKLSVHTHSTDDYINANYMPGYYSKKDFIATQGPLPNTLKDFWRMVWEKNVYTIVMLTKCVEQGRTKCEEYWPSKQSHDYGAITVAMTSEIVLPEWTIRDFTVKNNQTSESHPLRQFHFTSWPDHGVPDTTDLLINFRYLVCDYMKQCPPESPVLVHCSAGVGRTGTFIAIDRLIYQIENENTVDVYGIVYDLRMHRPLMVQTEDQYVFLNQCVLDIIRSQKDTKVDLIYQNTTAMTIYENLAPVTMFGKTNGYIA